MNKHQSKNFVAMVVSITVALAVPCVVSAGVLDAEAGGPKQRERAERDMARDRERIAREQADRAREQADREYAAMVEQAKRAQAESDKAAKAYSETRTLYGHSSELRIEVPEQEPLESGRPVDSSAHTPAKTEAGSSSTKRDKERPMRSSERERPDRPDRTSTSSKKTISRPVEPTRVWDATALSLRDGLGITPSRVMREDTLAKITPVFESMAIPLKPTEGDSLRRSHSKLGGLDLSVTGLTDKRIHELAKALSAAVGPERVVVVEQVMPDRKVQRNTAYWNGSQSPAPTSLRTQTATGTHIHIQTNSLKKIEHLW
jgi:hypothetical protein